MGWQDELRRLDDERTAGRLSAEEYQRRRTELIAAAGPEPDNAAEPDGGQPASPQKNPFPPPFRWDTTPTNATTDVFEPVRIDDESDPSEQTQIVGKPDQPRPATSSDDSESTQIVANAPPFPQPPYRRPPAPGTGGFTPAPEPARWAQQETAPPWLAPDLPPIREPNAAWATQGPDFFISDTKDSGFLRIIAVAAAVVVLAGIGITAFFLFTPDGSDRAVPATAETAPPAVNPAPEPAPEPAQPPESPIVDLPGDRVNTSMIQSFADVVQLPRVANPLTPAELDVLSEGEADEVAFALSWDGETKINIMVVQVRDAAAVRDELAELQVQFRLRELRGFPDGVRAAGDDRVPGAHPVLRRAHYASDDYVIRVEISDVGAAKADRLFEQIVDAQHEKLPADA